jgi:hypothetical protein
MLQSKATKTSTETSRYRGWQGEEVDAGISLTLVEPMMLCIKALPNSPVALR